MQDFFVIIYYYKDCRDVWLHYVSNIMVIEKRPCWDIATTPERVLIFGANCVSNNWSTVPIFTRKLISCFLSHIFTLLMRHCHNFVRYNVTLYTHAISARLSMFLDSY